MRELARLLRQNEDWLMNRTLTHALAHGYTAYTSIAVEDWRLSIAGLSDALLEAMPADWRAWR